MPLGCCINVVLPMVLFPSHGNPILPTAWAQNTGVIFDSSFALTPCLICVESPLALPSKSIWSLASSPDLHPISI